MGGREDGISICREGIEKKKDVNFHPAKFVSMNGVTEVRWTSPTHNIKSLENQLTCTRSHRKSL